MGVIPGTVQGPIGAFGDKLRGETGRYPGMYPGATFSSAGGLGVAAPLAPAAPGISTNSAVSCFCFSVGGLGLTTADAVGVGMGSGVAGAGAGAAVAGDATTGAATGAAALGVPAAAATAGGGSDGVAAAGFVPVLGTTAPASALFGTGTAAWGTGTAPGAGVSACATKAPRPSRTIAAANPARSHLLPRILAVPLLMIACGSLRLKSVEGDIVDPEVPRTLGIVDLNGHDSRQVDLILLLAPASLSHFFEREKE